MTAQEILAELQALGDERYKRVLMKNYGVREPCFGVKISELKKIQKRIKKDYRLALELYRTGNYDAMYLAGLIADDERMTRVELQEWAEKAYAGALPGATVPWVAAGNRHGWSLARRWVGCKKPAIAAIGWATLASIVSLKDDRDLDLEDVRSLLHYVKENIHRASDSERYWMNSFLIAVGCYIPPMTAAALESAAAIGPVTADLGDNNCQVPSAAEYIRKVQQRGMIGKKRKTVKC